MSAAKFPVTIVRGSLGYRTGKEDDTTGENGSFVNNWNAPTDTVRCISEMAGGPELLSVIQTPGHDILVPDRGWSVKKPRNQSQNELNKSAHVDYPGWQRVSGATVLDRTASIGGDVPPSMRAMTKLGLRAFGEFVRIGRQEGSVQLIFFWQCDTSSPGLRSVATEKATAVAYTIVGPLGVIALDQAMVHGLSSGRTTRNVQGAFVKFVSSAFRKKLAANDAQYIADVRAKKRSGLFFDPLMLGIDGSDKVLAYNQRYAACLSAGRPGSPLSYPNLDFKPVQIPSPQAFKHFTANVNNPVTKILTYGTRQTWLPTTVVFSKEQKKRMQDTLTGWGLWLYWEPAFKLFEPQVDIPKKFPRWLQISVLGFVPDDTARAFKKPRC